eukprot:SAG22_NODE_185_length_15941_cov_8.668034_11_plen_77_part_00
MLGLVVQTPPGPVGADRNLGPVDGVGPDAVEHVQQEDRVGQRLVLDAGHRRRLAADLLIGPGDQSGLVDRAACVWG